MQKPESPSESADVEAATPADRRDAAKQAIEALLPMRPVEFYILLALAEGDLHGYGIIQATLERSRGSVRLDPGTLYRAIVRLADTCLLEEADRRRVDDDLADRRRRYYAITELGRRVARAEAERMADLVDDARASRLIRDLEGAS